MEAPPRCLICGYFGPRTKCDSKWLRYLMICDLRVRFRCLAVPAQIHTSRSPTSSGRSHATTAKLLKLRTIARPSITGRQRRSHVASSRNPTTSVALHSQCRDVTTRRSLSALVGGGRRRFSRRHWRSCYGKCRLHHIDTGIVTEYPAT